MDWPFRVTGLNGVGIALAYTNLSLGEGSLGNRAIDFFCPELDEKKFPAGRCMLGYAAGLAAEAGFLVYSVYEASRGNVLPLGINVGMKTVFRAGDWTYRNRVAPLKDLKRELDEINGGEEVVWDST